MQNNVIAKIGGILKSEKLKNALVIVMRLIVGITFIVSGFAKAIDPWGTVYKITDYLYMLNLTGLMPFVEFGAFALPVLEFLVGVFLLFGIYRRLAPITLVVMMLVFTPLTFYLAVADRVVDCGCFGDVLVLTNWQTFFKNVFLLVAGLYLLVYNRRMTGTYGLDAQWLVWVLSMAFMLLIGYFGYAYQPLIDFRSYGIGERLYYGPKYDAEAEEEFEFIYIKDGVEKSFSIDSLPNDDWEYVDRRLKDASIGVEAGYKKGVEIYDENVDRTAELLDSDSEQLIFVFTDFQNIGISYTYLINELAEFATSRGVNVFGVAYADDAQIATWNDLSMAQYPIYLMEDTQMKILARGNPAVVYVRDGKVVWKRALQAIRNDLLQKEGADMETIVSDYNPSLALKTVVLGYVLLMILVLIFNRTHRVVKFSIERIKKNHKKDVTLQKED